MTHGFFLYEKNWGDTSFFDIIFWSKCSIFDENRIYRYIEKMKNLGNAFFSFGLALYGIVVQKRPNFIINMNV